jgi:peptidoglycan hydrolase CwlO-like protein
LAEIRPEVTAAENEVDEAKERYGDTSEEYFEKTDKLESLNAKHCELEDELEDLENEYNEHPDVAAESTEDQ